MTEAQRWLQSHGFAHEGEYPDDEVSDHMERLLRDEGAATFEQAEGFPWPFRWMFSDGSAVAMWLDNWECELRCAVCGIYRPEPTGVTCTHCERSSVQAQVPTASDFDLHADFRERPVEQLGTNGVATLMAFGIVNPYGPTLNVLALEGDYEGKKLCTVLHVMLNPFAQEVKEVGTARIGDEWNPLDALAPFLGLPFGACPTLLLPSSLMQRDECASLYASLLAKFPDGSEVLRKVRRYPGDPWGRVQEDMNGFATLIRDYAAGRTTESESPRQLRKEEAEELAALLLNPDSLFSEMQAFMAAWKGSIEHCGDTSLAESAMSQSTFLLRYFSILTASCDLPGI